jgi:hypothetical protein
MSYGKTAIMAMHKKTNIDNIPVPTAMPLTWRKLYNVSNLRKKMPVSFPPQSLPKYIRTNKQSISTILQ